MGEQTVRDRAYEDGILLTENARKVLERRYLRKGLDGRPVETIEEMFHRVARAIAAVEPQYGGDAVEMERRFYELLTTLRFLPNSPTFTGAGTPLGQLAACFVLPIADDMGKRPDGIFSTLRAAALIQQTGGGNGFSFSRLRPRGEHVVTSAGQATGPVGFLRVYDKAFGEIAQGGSRRGANMGVLRVDHPDIREFIRCKAQEGEITNFNISVAITDDFMRAVENDEMWELRFPDVEDPRYREFHGTINQAEKAGIPIKVYGQVRARELFDEIVKHAHHNGEPGVLFIDTANRDNPVPHLYELEATNPCVTGDTLVATPTGWRRVDQIRVGDEILTVSGVGRVAEMEINFHMPVYLVQFSDGGSVRATASHQFYVRDPQTGAFHPRRLDALRVGDEVQVLRPMPMPVEEAGLTVHDSLTETSSMFEESDHLPELDATEGTAYVLSITPAGIETVYDLYEPETDTWITAGYVSRGCGEQWLGPYENCCLGSINLARHVTEDDRIDWEKLRETIETATRFLDNVVTANKYVPAVPQLKEAAEKCRRIGLGIMGLADVMYRLGVRYGSPEGEELASQIMEFVRFHAMKTSIQLARERGPFPAIKGSIYDPEDIQWKPPTPLRPYERDFGRPPIDWNEIVQGIRQHGIRNAAQTTIAPTGTIATVAGCEGYGCEPVFALAYIRHVQDGDRVLDLQYTSPLFEKALIEAGIDEETRQAIYEEVMRTGTCQHIEAVPEHIRHTFVVASDITPEEHVRMQAALQRFVDNSISKCVVGDTLLLTPNGLIPIQELAEAPLPDQFVPLAMQVISPEGVETTDAFYYGGYRETRKVALQYGFEIEGTPNHRIHILDAEGNVVFRRLDELKPGDVVVLYAGQQCFGPSGAELPAFSGAFRTSSKSVHFPKHMSTDLAFLLGCITSEGAITANGINIANTDVTLLKELQRIVMELFGIESHVGKDPRNDVHYLQVNSRALRHWLLSDLGLQSGAENKIIPTCILQAAREEIGAFLRGLFLDGYVTQDGRVFGITLASRRLIQQLQVLLLNFGIVATVRQVADRAWNLTVQGQELERLAAVVGFVEAWKNERLARRHEGRLLRLRNYSRLLPRSVTSALREMQFSSEASLRSHYFFFANDDERKVYVEVQSVTTGYAEVFDISVPGSHSFIANGLGNHNTINFPAHATVDDVARAYFQAWKLGCKGLTVYVTGTREKVVLETKATLEAKQRKEKSPEKMAEPNGSFIKKPRPRKLHGYTYKQATPLGNAYITVTEDEENHPFEVFLNVGKGGSDTAAAAEAIGRLISLVLRLPSERSPEERLREIVDELSGIGGGRSLGFGPERVSSLPDGVAKALAEYLGLPELQAPLSHAPVDNGDGLQFDADFCPECGNATLVREEGCRKCYSCGYSEC